MFYPLEVAYRMVSHQNQTTQKLTLQYPIQALKQATEKQIAYTLWQLKAHPQSRQISCITLTKPTTKYSHGSCRQWQTTATRARGKHQDASLWPSIAARCHKQSSWHRPTSPSVHGGWIQPSTGHSHPSTRLEMLFSANHLFQKITPGPAHFESKTQFRHQDA